MSPFLVSRGSQPTFDISPWSSTVCISIVTFNKCSTSSSVQIKELTFLFSFFFSFSPDCNTLMLIRVKKAKQEKRMKQHTKWWICRQICTYLHNIYVLDTRVNLDTCGRSNSIRIRYVWTRKSFKSATRYLWIQKYPDTCGRGLSFSIFKTSANNTWRSSVHFTESNIQISNNS